MQTQHITKTTLKSLATLLTCIVLSVTPAIAQDDWEEAGNNDVPVDGGLSVLLAVGAGYGAYKRKQAQKLVK